VYLANNCVQNYLVDTCTTEIACTKLPCRHVYNWNCLYKITL